MHDDPLILTGLQDITTHVDFSAVARAARGCGASVLGYTTQANFLLGHRVDREPCKSVPWYPGSRGANRASETTNPSGRNGRAGQSYGLVP